MKTTTKKAPKATKTTTTAQPAVKMATTTPATTPKRRRAPKPQAPDTRSVVEQLAAIYGPATPAPAAAVAAALTPEEKAARLRAGALKAWATRRQSGDPSASAKRAWATRRAAEPGDASAA